MPDHRKHRGKNPEDSKLFHEKYLPTIHEAVKDLSWLLTRGYKMNSGLKLVGDHYFLTSRQRIAVARNSCSDQDLKLRRAKEAFAEFCKNKTILVDGYNILITIESALSGGYIFKSRDGCYRDIASIHGSYKRVEETETALNVIGKNLETLKPEKVLWYLDSPISNSARLKQTIKVLANKHHWNWEVELVHNPDSHLKHRTDIIVTSDSMILNEVSYWINLSEIIIQNEIKEGQVIDLSF